MTENYKRFIKTFESPNTIRLIKSMQVIGDYDYSNCSEFDIEQIILKLNPKSPKAITTICNVFRLYAKFLDNDRLYSMLDSVDRNKLWEKAKPLAARKFISHSLFERTYHDLGVFEEFNAFYYQTLFKCIFEGIYNDDLSVIKNLKASDIKDNVITLRDNNGNTYDLEVSEKLARDLREMSINDVWERMNRFGVCKIKLTGDFPDSCFKTEKRESFTEDSYRHAYYRVLRKISKEYLGYSLLPLQLFVSGIMYRIKLKLEENGIEYYDAFSGHNRDRMVHNIVENELRRCNYGIEVRNFREIVKGHLEIFIDI